ncbi:MAG: hypothetical protein IH969_04745 [Candidatus Krumholzibacteriota bacterium]|nr:hypothetical protein [Candidatus Krumholzibacteriota bacterium]
MRRSVIIAVAAILMVVAVSVAGADEPVLFAYVMEEGQAESFKVKFSQETDLGFFMLSFFVDMEVTERCIKADSVGYTMEMTFDKVEASRLFQEKMTQDPMSNNLTGARVTYRVDRHGEVTDIKATGYIEGWSQAERVIKPIIESGYAYLPDREVAAGGDRSLAELVAVHGRQVGLAKRCANRPLAHRTVDAVAVHREFAPQRRDFRTHVIMLPSRLHPRPLPSAAT